MTTCPAFNSESVVITASNYDEPMPQQYSRSVGSSVTAYCNDGYQLVGTPTFTCQSNGQWSYGSSPPDCLVSTATTTTEATPDENTWILIGVVCGVAFIIIAILIVMMVAIWYRDKRKAKKEELLMFNVNRMYPHETRDGMGPPAPYTRDEDIEMYDRPRSPVPPYLPAPPPYESGSRDGYERHHYIKNRERDFERHHDFDRYRDRSPYYEKKSHFSDVGRRSFHDYGDRESRLSSRMYLPDREYEPRKEGDPKSLYYKSRSFDDLSDRGRRPYDGPWLKKGYRNAAYDDMSDMFYDRPRDHRLWRNA